MNVSLEKFATVINELKSTNSAIEKINILSKYNNDIDICKYFYYAYNPFYLYGVSSKNLKKNNDISELEFFKDIFELLDILRTRQATGNKAIGLVNCYINQNNTYEDLLYDFFDRNLNIGMAVKQINKALKNIIPTFDVALAATYDESKKDKYNLDNYIIEAKKNGLRLITVITHDEKSNITEIKSYSRKGKEFTTCSKINEELMEYYKKSKYFGKNVVFDGEVCIVDENGKEDWNRAVSEAKKKNYTMHNPKYVIFDFLTLDEFSGVTVSRNYTFRRDQMIRNFFGIDQKKFKYLDIIFATRYSDDKFQRLVHDFVETEKWEGLIFRKDCSYKPGRSTDLLKFKLFKDAEFIVEDITVTTKPMLVNGVMEQTECMGAVVITYKGNKVQVGSGWTDEQRLEFYHNPTKIIGKQIQVKYKEETVNNDGTVSLQFPVVTAVFEDKRDF